jgi:cathepsin L
VNAIKDQGQCSSCWAFGAVQAAETAYFLAKGKLLSFSESNLNDCVKTCDGCDGGWAYVAYDWILGQQDGYFMLESDYPYKPVQGSCKFDRSKGFGPMTGYMVGTPGSEQDLHDKVTNVGAATIAIDASNWSFQLYTSGVYDEPSCSTSYLDHEVGCIGYGTTSGGVDYWIVRNSWGTSWGISGYIWMSRNKNNQCGIATEPYYPRF